MRSNNLQHTVPVILMKFSFNFFTHRGSLERQFDNETNKSRYPSQLFHLFIGNKPGWPNSAASWYQWGPV